MKSKLAIWSWILAIIGVVLYPGIQIILTIINPQHFGYADSLSAVEETLFLFLVFLMIGSALLGIVFGIVASGIISRNSNLRGKVSATVGIILNIPLLLYGIFALLGGLFGS